MKRTVFAFFTAINLLAFPSFSHADGGDGFGNVFNIFFGDESARVKNETCDGGDNDNGGLMGIMNSFFCHMEKDMGITGPTSGVTKTFDNMTVRAVVTAGSYTVDSVSYAYNAQVWVCHSGCSSTANFSRAINVYFSYSIDKSVNKGHLFMNPTAFESSGSSSSAINMKYDVASGTSTKTILAKAIFIEGGATKKMRFDGAKTSTTLGVSGIMHDGTNGFRLAAQLNTSGNSGGVYFEGSGASGPGTSSLNAATTGDDKTSSSMCFTRARSGTDWTYTATGSTGCTVKTFPSESANDVNSYTTNGVLTQGSLWEGMSANPSSI